MPAHSDPRYAGAAACARCHAGVHREWAGSSHRTFLQPATERTVRGDFARGRLVLHGSTYGLRATAGGYFITESELTGRPVEHRVEYALGGARVQHYLAKLPDGRIAILPPTWDAARKQWTTDQDIGNPEEAPGTPFQVWNKSCFACHVSRGQKNFALQQMRYRTAWSDLGADCETCHGPGSAHIANPRAAGTIVNPARLDAARSSMICAQCHSFRDTYADGFRAGANYYDFFQPVMEYRLPASEDPAYWPDGRPRWFSNSAMGLWQSQCFLKGGATCATCHSEHGERARSRTADAACARCHTAIGANISAHSHHAPASAGSSCIGCHMPLSVAGPGTRVHDHSMSIPAPENSIRHGIPNACNLCHGDRDAGWALRQMDAWYGAESRQKLIRRADAFTAARKGDATAIPVLLAILADPSDGPWVRANAAGYLGSFPNDPGAYDAVLRAFADHEPLVRATAASALRPSAGQRPAAAAALVPLLADSLLTVRVSAAVALVSMGVQPFPGEDGQRFERAKALYRARADLNNDDAVQQFAAGRFFFLAGDMDTAIAAFEAGLKLDPAMPARYLLAQSLAKKGDLQAARKILEAIPANDPQYAEARQLLGGLGGQSGVAADAQFRDAQTLYLGEHYGAALPELEAALRLAPEAAWAAKAQVYRAICLEKLGRSNEAEAAMQALAPAARQDPDLQLAHVELLYETGRAEEALKRIDEAIAAEPRSALAHFWRAKVLMELHRNDEAARAAEESVQLAPQLPQAHNLLIRIYQAQGRAKEAAGQAQWLRDYERQVKSR